MITFSTHKIAILRNPRTGFSSIKSAVKDIRNEFNIKENIPFNKIVDPNNDTPIGMDSICNYYGVTNVNIQHSFGNLQYLLDRNAIPDYDSEYKVYVFIRDPVERFTSICKNIRNSMSIIVTKVFATEFNDIMTEEDRILFFSQDTSSASLPTLSGYSQGFIDLYNTITIDKIASKFLTHNYFIFPESSRIPQFYYFRDSRVTALKYDNLQEEFNTICDKLGVERKQLPMLNQTTIPNSEYISWQNIYTIRQIYSEDVNFYHNSIGN